MIENEQNSVSEMDSLMDEPSNGLPNWLDYQTAEVIVSRSDLGTNQGEGIRTDLEWWFNDLLYAFLLVLWTAGKILAPVGAMTENEGVKRLGLAYKAGKKIL